MCLNLSCYKEVIKIEAHIFQIVYREKKNIILGFAKIVLSTITCLKRKM